MQQERKQVQKKREKDEGLKAAQRLLLTWLSDHPGQLNQLADIIMPEDFSDSLYQEVARLLYKQIEQGKGNPAELLTNFIEDESQYQEVAKIFNGETCSGDIRIRKNKRNTRMCDSLKASQPAKGSRHDR